MDFSWFYLTFFMYYLICSLEFIKIINIFFTKSFVYIKSILFVIEWIGRRIILSKIIRKKVWANRA